MEAFQDLDGLLLSSTFVDDTSRGFIQSLKKTFSTVFPAGQRQQPYRLSFSSVSARMFTITSFATASTVNLLSSLSGSKAIF